MAGMKGGTVTIVAVLLLLLVTAAFVLVFVKTYRSNYFNYNLLRLYPLEDNRLGQDEARLRSAEIWMVGDSRIARWNKSLLSDKVGIANLGIEGQTSAQVYYRFRNYLAADTPSVVILQVGINDLKVIGLDRNLEQEVVNNLIRNIEAICHLCIESNIKVILQNIIPVGKIEPARRLVWNRSVEDALRSVNKDIKALCDNKHIFHYDACSLLSDDGIRVLPEYQDDFLHINESGYKLLSDGLKVQISYIINNK